MAVILPPRMNAGYTGPVWISYALVLLGMLELIPALIHTFAPDGGAFSIAGLNPEAGRETIIGVFAWAGATQFVFALTILAVAFHYRVFLRAILTLLIVEKSIIALNAWVLKESGAPHHPPGTYGVLAAIPVLLLLPLLSYRVGTGAVESSREHRL